LRVRGRDDADMALHFSLQTRAAVGATEVGRVGEDADW
jgi:hypothetical protein